MAKRKTPKSQKVVDLKPRAEKLEENELKELQGIVQKVNTLHTNLGRLSSQQHELNHQLAGVNDEIRLKQTELESKYGNCDIDIRTGELKYPENGQVDS
jgi:hypothetical protein